MKATFGFSVFIVSYLLACSYTDAIEKAIEAEKKAKPKPTQYAPIRPAKCSEFAAGQADGGKWKILYCKRGARA